MLIDFMPFKHSRWDQEPALYQRVSDAVPQKFTSNNNLSVRKEKLNGTLYDESMRGGEDMYLCMSLLQKRSKYLIDDQLYLYHRSRRTHFELLKQFFRYGVFGVDALKALRLKKLEIFSSLSFSKDQFKLLIKLPFPVKGLIYLDLFTIHTLTAITSALTINPYIFGISMCFLFLYYLRELGIFFYLSPFKSLKLIGLNYLVNLSFQLGGLKQSLSKGIVFVPPSLHKSQYAIPARFSIFFKKKLENEKKHKLYEIFDSTCDQGKVLELLSENYIRIQLQNTEVILKKVNFIFQFYFVIDFVEK